MHRWSRACLLTLMLAALPAHAQEDATFAKARELLQVMRAEQMAQKMSDVMFQSMMGPARTRFEQSGCAAGNKVFADFSSELRALMQQSFARSNYLDDMARIYANTFTRAELQDTIAYYKSPTGQKFLDRQVDLLDQGALIGQRIVASIQPELEALAKRHVEDLASAMDSCSASAKDVGGSPPHP